MRLFNSNPAEKLIPPFYERYLFERRQIDQRDNPLLVIKLISDSGPIYIFDLHHDEARGVVATCFEPGFGDGYPINSLKNLEENFVRDPDFVPCTLRAVADPADPIWSECETIY